MNQDLHVPYVTHDAEHEELDVIGPSQYLFQLLHLLTENYNFQCFSQTKWRELLVRGPALTRSGQIDSEIRLPKQRKLPLELPQKYLEVAVAHAQHLGYLLVDLFDTGDSDFKI